MRELDLDLNLLGLASTNLKEVILMIKRLRFLEFQFQNRMRIETQFQEEILKIILSMMFGEEVGRSLGKRDPISDHEGSYL